MSAYSNQSYLSLWWQNLWGTPYTTNAGDGLAVLGDSTAEVADTAWKITADTAGAVKDTAVNVAASMYDTVSNVASAVTKPARTAWWTFIVLLVLAMFMWFFLQRRAIDKDTYPKTIEATGKAVGSAAPLASMLI